MFRFLVVLLGNTNKAVLCDSCHTCLFWSQCIHINRKMRFYVKLILSLEILLKCLPGMSLFIFFFIKCQISTVLQCCVYGSIHVCSSARKHHFGCLHSYRGYSQHLLMQRHLELSWLINCSGFNCPYSPIQQHWLYVEFCQFCILFFYLDLDVWW